MENLLTNNGSSNDESFGADFRAGVGEFGEIP